MTTRNILILPGDGIGPEVMAEALRVLDTVASRSGLSFTYHHELVGGAAIDADTTAFAHETVIGCASGDSQIKVCTCQQLCFWRLFCGKPRI
jgi:3-isopropylmalate dehydrogenase